ncbi:MAG: hydroxymethylbilane synthase [Thermodesulfobacteria bacterium]|nr:hydroxymethylbilane synthase [Thermodesulfobacteriota bacterium]
MKDRLVLATRKSKLALAQSTWVKNQLEQKWPGCKVELLKVTTKGDKILDVPLAKVGGKGLFVKEIEEAMLDGRADLAVHSLKDVPTEIPEGLEVSIFPKREDFRDAFISRSGGCLADLPQGAKVGTSSLRRMAQLRILRSDLQIESLRGNLDTRLRKLDEGNFDAIILAAAGLNRLGLSDRISCLLSTDVMIPAIGQGALGIEFRSDDEDTRQMLKTLHHQETAICVEAERAFLETLEGGCQVPIGAVARLDGQTLYMEGIVADEQGKRVIRQSAKGAASEARSLGQSLAKTILDLGGREILEEVYSAN